MSILVSRCDSLQDDPIICLIRKRNSNSSQRCLFHPPQGGFVFPALPPFSFKESDVLTKYPFYHVKSLHSFQSMFLPGGSHEDALQVHYSSFSFFSGGFNSSFVDHIFSSFQMFSHVAAHHIHSFLTIQLFRSAEDISEDSSCHSQFAQILSRL